MKAIFHLTWIDNNNLAHSSILNESDREKVIGRSHSADIIVDNPSVSRRHAKLSWKDGVLVFEDLDSTYGSWLGNLKVSAARQHPLYEKGEIRLGGMSLWYECVKNGNNIEVPQTVFHQDINSSKEPLPDYLQNFRFKLLTNMRSQDLSKELTTRLEEIIDREIQILALKQEEQVRTHKVLNSISRVLNGCLTIEDLSKNTLDLLSKILGADRGFFMTYRPDNKQFDIICRRNFNDPKENHQLNAKTMNFNPLLTHCYDKKDIVIVGNTENDNLIAQFKDIDTKGALSILLIPIIQNEQINGILYLDSTTRYHCFEEKHISFLQTFADHASIALHNVQLYRLAITDDLTGLYTRKFINERLEHELERSKRYNRPFSVLIMDIDHFKRINDSYGHIFGDYVLQNISQIVTEQLRDVDIAGRLGGEEFIVILGETPLLGAVNFADRLREKIEKLNLKNDGHQVFVTASFGVAEYSIDYNGDLSLYLREADKALYTAKSTGRNKVVAASCVHPVITETTQL